MKEKIKKFLHKPRSKLRRNLKVLLAFNLIAQLLFCSLVPFVIYADPPDENIETTEVVSEEESVEPEKSYEETLEERRNGVYYPQGTDIKDLNRMLDDVADTNFNKRINESFIASQYAVPLRDSLYNVVMANDTTKTFYKNIYNDAEKEAYAFYYRPLYVAKDQANTSFHQAYLKDLFETYDALDSNLKRFYIEYLDEEGNSIYQEIYRTNAFLYHYYTIMQARTGLRYFTKEGLLESAKDSALFVDQYGNIVLGSSPSGGARARGIVVPNIINPYFSYDKIQMFTRATFSSMDFEFLEKINNGSEKAFENTIEGYRDKRFNNGIILFKTGEKNPKDLATSVLTDLQHRVPNSPLNKELISASGNVTGETFNNASNTFMKVLKAFTNDFHNGAQAKLTDIDDIFGVNYNNGYNWFTGWNLFGMMEKPLIEASEYWGNRAYYNSWCNRENTFGVLLKSFEGKEQFNLDTNGESWHEISKTIFKDDGSEEDFIGHIAFLVPPDDQQAAWEDYANSHSTGFNHLTNDLKFDITSVEDFDLIFYSTVTGFSPDSELPSKINKGAITTWSSRAATNLKAERVAPVSANTKKLDQEDSAQEKQKEEDLKEIIQKIYFFLTKPGTSLTNIATSKNSYAYHNISGDNNTKYLLHISQIYKDESFQWLVKQYYLIIILVNIIFICFNIFNLFRGSGENIKEFFKGLIKVILISNMPIVVIILAVAAFNKVTDTVFADTFKYWSLIDSEIEVQKLNRNISSISTDFNLAFREVFENEIQENRSAIYIYGNEVTESSGMYEQFFNIEPGTRKIVAIRELLDNSSELSIKKGNYTNISSNPENIFINKDNYKRSTVYYFYDVLRYHLYEYTAGSGSNSEFEDSFNNTAGMHSTTGNVEKMYRDPYFLFGQSYIDSDIGDFSYGDNNKEFTDKSSQLKVQDICLVSNLMSGDTVHNLCSFNDYIESCCWYTALKESKKGQVPVNNPVMDYNSYENRIINASYLDLPEDKEPTVLEISLIRTNAEAAKELIELSEYRGYTDESLLLVGAIRLSQIYNDEMNMTFRPKYRCLPYQFETRTYSMDTVYRSMFLTTAADFKESSSFFGDLMYNLQDKGGLVVQYSILACAYLSAFAGLMTYLSLVVLFLLCMVVFLIVYNFTRQHFNLAWLGCATLFLSLIAVHTVFLLGLSFMCVANGNTIMTSPIKDNSVGIQIVILIILLVLKIIAICVVLFFAFRNIKDLGGTVISDTIQSASAKINGVIQGTKTRISSVGDIVKLNGKNIYSTATGKSLDSSEDTTDPDKKNADEKLVTDAKSAGEKAVEKSKTSDTSSDKSSDKSKDSNISDSADVKNVSSAQTIAESTVAVDANDVNVSGDTTTKSDSNNFNLDGVSSSGDTNTSANEALVENNSSNSTSTTTANNSSSTSNSESSNSSSSTDVSSVSNNSTSSTNTTSSNNSESSSNSSNNVSSDSSENNTASNNSSESVSNTYPGLIDVTTKNKETGRDTSVTTAQTLAEESVTESNSTTNVNSSATTGLSPEVAKVIDRSLNPTDLNQQYSGGNSYNSNSFNNTSNNFVNNSYNTANVNDIDNTQNIMNSNSNTVHNNLAPSPSEISNSDHETEARDAKLNDIALSIDRAVNNNDDNAGALGEAIKRAQNENYFN